MFFMNNDKERVKLIFCVCLWELSNCYCLLNYIVVIILYMFNNCFFCLYLYIRKIFFLYYEII